MRTQMRIPQCHPNVTVAEELLDDRQIDPFHHQPTRKAVAQIMPSKIRYSRTFHCRLPTVLHILNRFARELPLKMRKDVLGLAALLL